MNDKIFVTQPSMPSFEEYVKAIRPLWDTHGLTNMGCYHKELEDRLREYLSVENLSLMVNGHMALELTIQSFEFPENSEVITTPFTFISTTHAIVRNRLKPVFCDVKETDGTIDEKKIEELITEKTVAIIPVHVYGNICNLEEIKKIADKYNLKVIYDACHAFGIKYRGKGIGCYGDASVFSFHATKVYNSIEGGAVTFSDSKMYEKLYNLKNFGIRNEELVVEVGANAKMNEFAAIMGICNLKHVDQAIKKREMVFNHYRKCLEGVKGIRIFCSEIADNKNFGYLPLVIGKDFGLSRDELYLKFKESNIYSRKYFYPLTADQACFKNKYKNVNLTMAREISNMILVLPLFEMLELEKVEEICNIICEVK
ncbi:MAG: DegT/DnrJ/EryC1/StrS family aminotransferase [Lachnospiraceae bacterium]|nr:DegT/DnrJ/EryC1/StrS family aminotransferase [Lachnospiraceae bacterium]